MNTKEFWDITMKITVSRYNRAYIQNDNFVDLSPHRSSNHELRIAAREIDKIFDTNFTTVVDVLSSIWKLSSIAHG